MFTLGKSLRTVLTLILMAPAALAVDAPGAGPISADRLSRVTDPGPSRVTDFSYAKLTEIIRDHDVRTVDELLPLIPESYRKFYLFLYESRSAQAANTFSHSPRTILYGESGTFLMAFTKDPKAAPAVDAADNVETIQWNAEAKRFEFRELVFGEGKNPLEVPPEVNPLKCQACHGKDPRPNWDPYNIWAGSYGSVSRLGCDTMQAGTEEIRKYYEFMTGNRKKDRYQHLPAEMSAEGKCIDDPAKEVTFRNAAHLDPNAIFTQKVTHLNYQRLGRMVMKAPRYKLFRPYLAAQANNCVSAGTIEKFFPEGYAKAERFLTYGEALADVIATGKAEFAQRLGRFMLNSKGSAVEEIRQPVNFLDPDDKLGGMYTHRFEMALVRIFADRMRLSMNRWTLAFSDGQYEFTTPSGMPSAFFYPFREQLVDLAGKKCEELQALSIAEFTARGRK